MPNKHVIFLVHGMGDFEASWSEPAQTTIRNQYGAYAQLSFLPFEQRFEFQELFYNDEFEALRKMWRKSSAALGTALKATGIAAPMVASLNELAQLTDKKSFMNTHVLDVLLYRFARQTASTIRESLRVQILKKLTSLDQAEPIRWSIVAHSLGTSVIHDTLHEMYSDTPTKVGEKLSGFTRPDVVAMIANVSRVLEEDIDVYESRVRPGNPDDPSAACKYYLNAKHFLDPIPQAKAFQPALHWPSIGVRNRGLLLDIGIREIEQLNVHDFDHYLRNPRVHCHLFNCLLDREAIDAAAINTAQAQFAAHTPLDDFGGLVKKLKPFQLGEEDLLEKVMATWAKFLDLF